MTRKILLQLDPDLQPSVFDSVVAVDAEVDFLFRHGNVERSQVRDLVYGCIFTRGGAELANTAIFIGGSQVAPAEALFEQVQKTFFGPMRVSVMFDANGCNTTAAAAVVAASRHLDLTQTTACVLGGTGPVGQRVARLLLKAGAQVRLASRQLDKASAVCQSLKKLYPEAALTPCTANTEADTQQALQGVQFVIAAGAPGVCLLSTTQQAAATTLRVAIDLNAVPPLGIAAVAVTDKAADKQGVICYGALGVGGTKMKIHKAALRQLFTANDFVLDAEQIYQLGLAFA
jgi:methylenetetrahydrofolate/methylenetetrahydromethanopterin dehydrogenase (NADP+)